MELASRHFIARMSSQHRRHIEIVTQFSGHKLKAIINMVYNIPASVESKDWDDLKNAANLVFLKKRSHEEIV